MKAFESKEASSSRLHDNEQFGGKVLVENSQDDEVVELEVSKKDKGKGLEQDKVHEKPSEKTKPFLPPPYQPRLPFTRKFKKQLLEKYIALIDKQMEKVEITMPLIEDFLLVPQYTKFLKDAIVEKLKKLQVSLMPFSIARKLDFTVFKPCRISLVLADRSVRLPVGLLEDLPVKIGDFEVSTDFIVLQMDDEPNNPLILGKSFLATNGAIIDVRNGKIDLHLGSEVLKFDINEVMKKLTIKGQVFYIETVDQLADELLEELL
ncbi:uncharacterized protein LOC112082015 [Eutrema salsugineum]|uniref:uncharacterized protein LOC112082015 n=1 Tax=Eutrema salsugineum TaxID=72664 RepID=UPI000CED514A|nr:uncharacterized protein LOC112082015 [Eutrema salsugineum]